MLAEMAASCGQNFGHVLGGKVSVGSMTGCPDGIWLIEGMNSQDSECQG